MGVWGLGAWGVGRDEAEAWKPGRVWKSGRSSILRIAEMVLFGKFSYFS